MAELEQTVGNDVAGPRHALAVWSIVPVSPYFFQYYHVLASKDDVQALWDVSLLLDPRPLTGIQWVNTHLQISPNALYLNQDHGVGTASESLQRFLPVVQFLNQYFAAKSWVNFPIVIPTASS